MTPAIAAAFRLLSVLLLSAVALDDVSVRSFLGSTFSGCIGAALTGTSTSIGAAASSARHVVPAAVSSSAGSCSSGGTLVAEDAPAHRPDFFRLLLDLPAAISGLVQPSATCASDHEVGPEQPRGGGKVNPVAFRPSADDACQEAEAADQCCIDVVRADEAGTDWTCASLEATAASGASAGGGGDRPPALLQTTLARLVSYLPGRGIIRSIFEAVVGQDPSTFETNEVSTE